MITNEFNKCWYSLQTSTRGADPNANTTYYMTQNGGSFAGGKIKDGVYLGNMGGHHPSWAPGENFPPSNMNPTKGGGNESMEIPVYFAEKSASSFINLYKYFTEENKENDE